LLSNLGINTDTGSNFDTAGSSDNSVGRAVDGNSSGDDVSSSDNDTTGESDSDTGGGFDDNSDSEDNSPDENSVDDNRPNDDNRADDNGPSQLVGDAMAGASLFAANTCSACHGQDGSGPPNIIGRSSSSLAEHARDGQEHPGGAFPSLTDQDLANLAAFLAR